MKKLSIIFLLLATTSLFATTQHYINVGSQKYWTLQSGSKKPTIIFFNGAGETLQTWDKIFPRLTKTQRFFAYDRAGIGKSSPLVNQITARTAQNIVKRLRALLNAADVKPPYVLVAHSIGSLYALYFARAYPGEVKGMVLLEPSVDAKIALGKMKNLSKKQRHIVANLTRQINFNFFNEKERFLNYRGSIKHNPTLKEEARIEFYLENLGKIKSQRQIDRLPQLKNISLVVISGGHGATQYDHMRRFTAKTVAQSIPKGRYKLIKNANHYVQNDAPQQVAAAIKSVL